MGCGFAIGRGSIYLAGADAAPADEARPGCSERSSESSSAVLSRESSVECPSLAELLLAAVRVPEDVFAQGWHDECVLSVEPENASSSTAVEAEAEFAAKRLLYDIADRTDSLDGAHARLAAKGVGMACRKGRGLDEPNQDNIFYCSVGCLRVCGVADGHGEHGHLASEWASHFALSIILSDVCAPRRMPYATTLEKIFNVSHAAMKLRADAEHVDLSQSGTTLSLCFVDDREGHAIVAYVGDSQCLLGGSCSPGLQTRHVEKMCFDFDMRDETTLRMCRCTSSDTSVQTTVESSVLRSLGDFARDDFGCFHTPSYKAFPLQQGRQYVICCSDGIWEHVSYEEADDIIEAAGRAGVRDSTEAVLRRAQERWGTEQETHDVSAVVMWI